VTLQTTVTAVEPLAERWLRVAFADGAVHEVDGAPVLAAGGVFAPLRDNAETFRAVDVDAAFGALRWPGDVDIDPDVLRGDAAAPAGRQPLPRRIIQPA
jgi:hypothetical protein